MLRVGGEAADKGVFEVRSVLVQLDARQKLAGIGVQLGGIALVLRVQEPDAVFGGANVSAATGKLRYLPRLGARGVFHEPDVVLRPGDIVERAAVGRGGICLVAEQLGLRDIARLIYRLGRRLRRDRLAAGGQRQGGGQSQAQGGAKILSFHAVFSFVPIIGTSYRIPQLDYGTGPELCQAPAPYSLRRFRMNFTASSRRGSSAARLPLTETAATARPAASSTGQPMQ